jgi:hypothetical protein
MGQLGQTAKSGNGAEPLQVLAFVELLEFGVSALGAEGSTCGVSVALC